MIKKYICKYHNLITSRKSMRKHLRDYHARNDFISLEDKTYTREEFIDAINK
jgi:hypothetical protein